jgi:hypothetical protein
LNDAKAPLVSPALTGTPTAPTATDGTNTTQLATTAFVQAAKPTIENVLTSTSTTNALSAAQGKALNDAKAPLVSPALTGTPTAPTAAAGTNTTQLATTAFVQAALNAEFASLKASSGYTKLPNDLILQWGTFSTPAAANTDVTVTFPIAFPNACLSAGCTSEAEQAIGIAAFTKTNVTVSKGASDHYARFGYWYSIGH